MKRLSSDQKPFEKTPYGLCFTKKEGEWRKETKVYTVFVTTVFMAGLGGYRK